jgi:polyferredoxin
LPSWAYGLRLRLALFVGLMGFLIGRLLQAPGDWRHWGYVFWEMCLVTTAVALIGGLLFRPRAWCVICPMGTMQNLLGGTRGRLGLAPERCVACGACDRACTLSLPVSQHRERGRVAERDCLLCGECVAACPRGALRGGRTASTPQRECA